MASMKFKLTSSIFLPHGLDLRPNAAAFPGAGGRGAKERTYGGNGVLGVFDLDTVLGYLPDEAKAEARARIERVIAKGGAYPLGAEPSTIASVRAKSGQQNTGVIVLETMDGRGVKRPVQRSRGKGNAPKDLIDSTSTVSTNHHDAGEFVEILRSK